MPSVAFIQPGVFSRKLSQRWCPQVSATLVALEHDVLHPGVSERPAHLETGRACADHHARGTHAHHDGDRTGAREGVYRSRVTHAATRKRIIAMVSTVPAMMAKMARPRRSGASLVRRDQAPDAETQRNGTEEPQGRPGDVDAEPCLR